MWQRSYARRRVPTERFETLVNGFLGRSFRFRQVMIVERPATEGLTSEGMCDAAIRRASSRVILASFAEMNMLNQMKLP
jgi:hypothetical protein